MFVHPIDTDPFLLNSDLLAAALMVYALRSMKNELSPTLCQYASSSPNPSSRPVASIKTSFTFAFSKAAPKPNCTCIYCTKPTSTPVEEEDNPFSGMEGIAHLNSASGSEHLMKRLSVRAIQTGLCTAFIAVAAVVCFNTMPNNGRYSFLVLSDRSKPQCLLGCIRSTVATMLGMILGRFYVLTIIYNLNVRRPTGPNPLERTRSFTGAHLLRRDPSDSSRFRRGSNYGMDQGMPSGRSGESNRLRLEDTVSLILCPLQPFWHSVSNRLLINPIFL